MILINRTRILDWLGMLNPAELWNVFDNGWKWRVSDRFTRNNKSCITFRLINPDGTAYEQTTYSALNKDTRNLSDHPEQMIAEAIISIFVMKQDGFLKR